MAIPNASAQTVCACSPSTYEFTFDFSKTCPRPGGNYPPGVAEVTCFVTSFSADVADRIPVSVETISIIEADTQRVPIAQSAIEGDFLSGDSFTYSSVSALGNAAQIPQSIQLTITGTNSANSSLVQVWAIKFTNECDVYPVLEKGEAFGWTEFTVLGTPQTEVCPAASSATPAPSFISTGGNPLVPPNEEPTDPPTMTPETPAPTPEPVTAAPTVAEETPRPTVVEDITTDPPTVSPTVQPTLRPTMRPTLAPPTLTPTSNSKENTKAPKTPAPTAPKGGGKEPTTDPPTIRPVMEPKTPSPTRSPMRLPTRAPTQSSESLEEARLPTEMSFSYYMDLKDEDFDMEVEWGREGKKSKKDKKEDSRKDYRGRVRAGGRRRF